METETMFAVVAVAVAVCTTVVAILRPITRHLGAYLEALTRQRLGATRQPSDERMDRIESLLLSMQEELVKVREDRDFYKELYPEKRRALPSEAPQVEQLEVHPRV